jgi:hypothetical protein
LHGLIYYLHFYHYRNQVLRLLKNWQVICEFIYIMMCFIFKNVSCFRAQKIPSLLLVNSTLQKEKKSAQNLHYRVINTQQKSTKHPLSPVSSSLPLASPSLSSAKTLHTHQAAAHSSSSQTHAADGGLNFHRPRRSAACAAAAAAYINFIVRNPERQNYWAREHLPAPPGIYHMAAGQVTCPQGGHWRGGGGGPGSNRFILSSMFSRECI